MSETLDPRAPLDAQINSPGREGLTGTAPADLYAPPSTREQITLPPDGRSIEDQPAWREDFPVDWPQDQYVERRDFMKFMVLTSFAFTVGQFWIGTQNWWHTRHGLLATRRIASLDSLPIGGSLVFEYPGEHDICVLVRLADAEVVAYRPEVHASLVRCGAKARAGRAALPLS